MIYFLQFILFQIKKKNQWQSFWGSKVLQWYHRAAKIKIMKYRGNPAPELSSMDEHM
jgi:hypothetical protein